MVQAVTIAVNTARATGQLEPAAEPYAALAVELARAVDVAADKRTPGGVAQASRELRDVLAQLGLTPRPKPAGGDSGDSFADFVAGLGVPEVGHPAHTGP